MKKVIALLALLAVAPATASAQQIALGARAGLNLANIGGEDAGDPNFRTGLSLGGFAVYKINDRFALQPEVLFTQKGLTEEQGTIDYSMNTSYLEVPVLAKLSLPFQSATAFTPALYAGPAVGLLLSAKAKMEDDGDSVEADLKDETKTLDFGFVLGAGLDFDKISFDVRYNLGLSSIDDAADPASVKNRVLSFSVGYLLPFGF